MNGAEVGEVVDYVRRNGAIGRGSVESINRVVGHPTAYHVSDWPTAVWATVGADGRLYVDGGTSGGAA